MSLTPPPLDIATLTELARETSLEAMVWFGKQLECKQNGVFSNTAQFPVGSEVIHGFFDRELDFIPVSTMVIGGRIKNRNVLIPIKPECIREYSDQTFVRDKAWILREHRVKTSDVIFPVAQFAKKYKDEVEVFAAVHEHEHRHTQVLCFVIMLKRAKGENRLMWQISIDDAHLGEVGTRDSIFR